MPKLDRYLLSELAQSVLATLVVLLIVCLGGAVFLAIKAYGNEQFELPGIGPMAKQWS